jgi:hypothetical protein
MSNVNQFDLERMKESGKQWARYKESMALLRRLQALANLPGGSAAQLYNWAEGFHARYAFVIEQVLYVFE